MDDWIERDIRRVFGVYVLSIEKSARFFYYAFFNGAIVVGCVFYVYLLVGLRCSNPYI